MRSGLIAAIFFVLLGGFVWGAEPATRPATGAATRPAEFEVRCRKKDDAVAVSAQGGTTVLAVTSPGGIGGATVRRIGGEWPGRVVLRVHLRGLESLVIQCGEVRLLISVASHGGNATTVALSRGGKEEPVTKESRYWTEVVMVGGAGKGVGGLPGKGGWFEVTVPAALLEGKADRFTLEWVDFYR